MGGTERPRTTCGQTREEFSGRGVDNGGVTPGSAQQPALPDFARFLAESAKVSVLITDRSGKIVWANEGFQRISGYAMSEILGRKPGELLQGAQTDPECVKFMSERLRAGQGFETDVLNYDREGREYWVSLEVTPIRSEEGEITHFIGVQHDITQHKNDQRELDRIRADLQQLVDQQTADLIATNRKLEAEVRERERAEQELRRSQLFLQSALDALSAHVAILDERGTIIAVNQAWRDFAGENDASSVSASVGKNYLEVCERAARSESAPEAAQMYEGIQQVLREERKDFYLQYPCHGPDEERWFQARVSRFRVGQDDRLVIAHENITEAKIAERRVRHQLEQLSHVQRLETMGEMSAALAHELNQPLSAISNYTSGSLRRLRTASTITPEVIDAMEQALSEANRAAEIIRRMRRFSRNAELQREPCSINEVVEEARRLVAGDTQRRSIRLRTNLATRVPVVQADAIHLQQVLINLIRNASDAMADVEDPEQRLVEITTDASAPGRVEVRVTDRGSGITPQAMERLFDPFVTTKQHGMGLGLAICRSIIEAHQGRIWARNDTDARGRTTGSTFGFYIPVTLNREK